ncbi:redoxin domain-containing protein [Paenibacillus macquariensis]|uniref:Peroxiredoxin n=1 Tax=Paenibacillus macquariensis TaxID=948756 RepID=A0ABY1JQ61_9BACL|nr:redoxin domain-containing protein [Paenibacillus macquariensis]MEC0094093.1 redoxin domain-containing protein [Paenibacillus macquariensis]OAB37552.1 hypothetical protein PMSM_05710 [Paenibacillus macquariensis subsp. macquariensis]SIQ56190.1 Peroxiredoxin [Paenibacillus macquariensis]
MRRLFEFLIIIAAVAAAAWVLYHSIHNENSTSTGTIEVDAIAPEFEITTLTGEKVQLKDYRGQRVLINFWASWCKPCVREMPLLNNLHTSSNSQVETLFINVGESKATVSDYLKDHQFSLPAAIDVTGRISNLYGVAALPATFIIDGEGHIRNAILGEITDFTLLQEWLNITDSVN